MIVPVTLLLAVTAPSAPPASTTAPEASTTVTAPAPAEPGVDGFVVGHSALGVGAACAALSTAAFVAGFDVERQLRIAPHDRGVVDALLVRRAVAAGVAWPAAVLAVVGAGVGVVTLAVDAARAAPTEAS
jgi:hypothetical protein